MRVNRSTKKAQARQVLAVKIKTDAGPQTFDTEEGIFSEVSTHLSKRFRLAFTAPCMSGELFDDISFLGNTDCAQQILEGTYVYLIGVDPATKFLMEEAGISYRKMSRKEISNYVSAEDFQHYWQTANERISSSTRLLAMIQSCLHFMLQSYQPVHARECR